MGEFSVSHLVIIAVVLLVFFGPSRLPGLGQSLGKAIRGFKEGINDLNKDDTAQNQGGQRRPDARSEQKTEQIPPIDAHAETITRDAQTDINHDKKRS